MNVVKHIILLIVFLFFSCLISYSQKNTLKFDHINTKQGLSHNTVHCILQDSYGFIWIGTEDGLNRFDGYEFKTFMHDNSDTLSISDNFIYSLYEDKDSQLWIGTNIGGLDKFDKRKEIFIHFRNNPKDNNSISDNRINTIMEDKEGFLWIGTNNGLNKKERNKQGFTHYFQDSNSINDNLIRTIFEDDEGIIWIGTNSGGLNKFNKATIKFKHYVYDPFNTASISDNTVKSIAESKNGILWIGTRKGLNKFDKKKEIFTKFFHNPSIIQSISNSEINIILSGQNGKIWVGTVNGLNVFNSKSEKFINYYHSASSPTSISSNVIFSITKDNSGLIWIGVAEGGINVTNSKPKAFIHYKHDPDNKNSIDYNVVRSFFEDKRGIIWIGTLNGLNSFNPKTQQFKHYNFATSLTAIYVDKQNTMWLGTWRAGMYKIPFSKRKESFEWNKKKLFLNDPENPKSISNNTVQDIYEDVSGNFWIGTESGLDLMDRKTNTFKTFLYNADNTNSISDNRIQTNCICEDTRHNLWVGTWNGLNKLEYKNGTYSFIRFLHKQANNNSLSDNRIISLLYDKKGVLWIGTYGGGLNKLEIIYDEKLKQENYFITSFTVKNGLSNNSIYAILEDEKANLWLSTNKGLSRFNTKTNKFRNYFESDGLQNDQFFWGAGLKLANGEMLFGGINGLNMFYPDSIHDRLYKPPIIITDLQIFNHSVKIGEKYNGKIILKKPIYKTKRINLTYKHKVISFQFASLDYANPKNNNYAYRMKGFETQWNYVNNRQYVTYTNLPAGDYVFEIKATNSDGIWNNHIKMLKITVSPPIWKTPLFIFFEILLVLSGIIVLIKKREKNLIREKRILNEKVKIRTTEIERQTEEIKTQRDSLEEQRSLLFKQNKEITDSIIYARHIQNAILPGSKSLKEIFPESFLFYKPKEIIGGDFYWTTKQKNKTIIAVADCTGHGVPGALMSMLGITFLNDIVKSQNIINPKEILNLMRLKIISTMQQKGNDEFPNDGMDIAVCTISTQEKIIYYAGANNPALLISNNNLIELKPDKMPVRYSFRYEIPFTTKEICYKENDMLYLFSDGFTDQFGGPEGKRFTSRKFKNILVEVSKLNVNSQLEKIENIFTNWKDNEEQVDDVLVLGIRL